MTEPNRNLTEVPGLITERMRYEAWIEALDARRESTPPHVFERVQADYRARLRRVADEIASYRQAIEEERTSVDSRLSLLEAEERMRRDERAELELRSHVGELAGEEAESAFAVVDEAVARLTMEKEGLQARITELDALLDQPDLPPEPSPKRISMSVPEPEIPKRISEAVPAMPELPPVLPAAPAPAVPSRTSAQREAVADADIESTEAVNEVPTPSDVADQVVTAVRPSTPANASPKIATPASGGESVQPASSGVAQSSAPRVSELRTPSGSFDELKFLNNVVGRTTLAGREGAAAADAGRGKTSNTAETPAARPDNSRSSAQSYAPTSTGTPNRPSAAIEQSKTLKCSECGAQNYPTEWYCERCGAELAAL
ncbi:MAG TPA: Ran-binding zinc finger domain-containing protein [Gemmatimonadaceae bacterium]|jgi:hypothetical protein|nr:Ran-binding zinc finger domain-containing protein [Gemmatimonadaceae bacterium]